VLRFEPTSTAQSSDSNCLAPVLSYSYKSAHVRTNTHTHTYTHVHKHTHTHAFTPTIRAQQPHTVNRHASSMKNRLLKNLPRKLLSTALCAHTAQVQHTHTHTLTDVCNTQEGRALPCVHTAQVKHTHTQTHCTGQAHTHKHTAQVKHTHTQTHCTGQAHTHTNTHTH